MNALFCCFLFKPFVCVHVHARARVCLSDWHSSLLLKTSFATMASFILMSWRPFLTCPPIVTEEFFLSSTSLGCSIEITYYTVIRRSLQRSHGDPSTFFNGRWQPAGNGGDRRAVAVSHSRSITTEIWIHVFQREPDRPRALISAVFYGLAVEVSDRRDVFKIPFLFNLFQSSAISRPKC